MVIHESAEATSIATIPVVIYEPQDKTYLLRILCQATHGLLFRIYASALLVDRFGDSSQRRPSPPVSAGAGFLAPPSQTARRGDQQTAGQSRSAAQTQQDRQHSRHLKGELLPWDTRARLWSYRDLNP